ncbi:Uncharacterized protein TCM_019785 isoform 1 [Theobroma cacao]|uniref:Uncharacterized protein isoform 1 n=1 Tax=Theobroma cacao TaxID=3641 RepID=A0A061EHQ9_THECC|nr:Uncharacterized protein TCM_019785 isoform 1 [Theobroma cacao]EOY04550.1 Uncharacterized protein TCM_019785 isoform 1 [Theobroma cacao]
MAAILITHPHTSRQCPLNKRQGLPVKHQFRPPKGNQQNTQKSTSRPLYTKQLKRTKNPLSRPKSPKEDDHPPKNHKPYNSSASAQGQQRQGESSNIRPAPLTEAQSTRSIRSKEKSSIKQTKRTQH